MFNTSSDKQLSLFDFKNEFSKKLDINNRWVKLANVLDWNKLASIFSRTFSSTQGAPSIDARICLGALIIKHLENKSDVETVAIIQENPYMQYFLGLDEFTTLPIFDPSTLTHIRKRLNNADFDDMNQLIILKSLEIKGESVIIEDKVQNIDSKEESQIPTELPNKGHLQLDATVADANITFPTDVDVINDARVLSEKIISKLHAINNLDSEIKVEKPRTYSKIAKKKHLNISKKKKKSKKEIRSVVRFLLSCLGRNLKIIDKYFLNEKTNQTVLTQSERSYYEVLKEVYRQQSEMFKNKTHSIQHRIVSVHQPHIRPIVRGKKGPKKVEFGPKINVSLENGYARITQFSFEAFNEGTFLIDQIESYKKLHGYYPELVQCDKIYLTRENRNYMASKNIRHTGAQLGRPKENLTRYQKHKARKEHNERNHIEGKFGTGKVRFGLNKILAKLPNTQECWVASIIFVMNILKLAKDIFVQKLIFIYIKYINIYSLSYYKYVS